MILLTRLGGVQFALNQDLIERADCTPDTVITLVDGTKYVITESLTELVERVRRCRAAVLTEAQRMEHPGLVPDRSRVEDGSRPTVVRLHRREQ